MQNNGKERGKACCTCKFVVLLIRKKSVLHVQFVFLLIRSIDAIFIGLPVLLTRASLLALAKSIYYIDNKVIT